MSEIAEQVVPKKRGRKPKIKPEFQETKTDAPITVNPAAIPVAEEIFYCDIPEGYTWETTVSGERARRPVFCKNEAKHIPYLILTGTRQEQVEGSQPPRFEMISSEYPARIKRGICDHHRKLAERDISTIISAQEIDAQAGEMVALGWPKPTPEDAKKTRILFRPFVPPKANHTSWLLDGLMNKGPTRKPFDFEKESTDAQ